MTTYPVVSDPQSAGRLADGSTLTHQTEHGRSAKQWENVLHHGADPTGGTDSSAAIIAAAAAGKNVFFPHSNDPTTYIYDSATALTLQSGQVLRAGTPRTELRFTGSKGIEFDSAGVSSIRVQDMYLTTTGPDLITLPSAEASVAGTVFDNVTFHAGAAPATTRLIYGTGSSLIFSNFVSCSFFSPSGMSVSPIDVTSAGNANVNRFYACTFTTTGTPTVPFVSATGSGGSVLVQWVFRDVALESCIGGFFIGNVQASIFDGIVQYDPVRTFTNDLIKFTGGGWNTVKDVLVNNGFDSGKVAVNTSAASDTAIYNMQHGVSFGTRTKLFNAANSGGNSGTEYTSLYSGASGGATFHGGLAVFTKAGAIVDGDFDSARNGMIALDTANGRFYVRYGGSWHYASLT